MSTPVRHTLPHTASSPEPAALRILEVMLDPFVRFANRSRVLWLAVFLLPFTLALEVFGIWSNPEMRWKFPIGHDYVAFWAAAKLFAQGGVDALYDFARVGALQESVSVRPGQLLWHYPPTYLFLILPLAGLSFVVGFLVFTMINLAALGAVAHRVMAFPGVLGWATLFGAPVMVAAIIQGQNGAIFGALLIAGIALRESGRPWAAALCIALLLAKPQYGVLIPVALLAARDWNQVLRIAICCVGFVGLVAATMGLSVWVKFADNIWMLGHVLDDRGMLSQMPTIWAAAVLAGLEGPIVPALHALFAWAAVSTVIWIWSSAHASKDVKLASVLIATLLISPYAFRYDMVITLAGMLLLVRRARAVEAGTVTWFALGCMWILPAIFPPLALSTGVQIGPIISLIGLGLCASMARESNLSLRMPEFRSQRLALPAPEATLMIAR